MKFVLAAPLRRRLKGTNADDLVRGTRQHPALSIASGGQLQLKGGSDRLLGTIGPAGAAGINLNRGWIRTGGGSDELVAIGGLNAYDSTLSTGKGSDTIIGEWDGIALNLRGSFLDTGSGDELIEARRGTSRHRPWIGLYGSLGSVDTGKGDDRIAAYGRLAGIELDEGLLSTGDGNDTVDVRHGGLATGYSQTPYISLHLGRGDDRFIGFAADPNPGDWTTQEPASVRGGRGFDILVLPPGSYQIQGDAVIGARNTLMAAGFAQLEALGGGSRPFADGLYQVDSSTVTALA
jgi:hypothetical protein